MINYETILSLFDDKLTLLEYLTKIEQALKNEQLTDITVTQTDASHVYFTFVFEDGSTIDTPTFSLPAGPQGIQGPQGEQGIQGEQGPAGADGANGVSVTGASIDAYNHLILTLSNGNTIDAGTVSTTYIVEVNGDTGTLSDANYNKCLNPSAIIKKNNTLTSSVYAVKQRETDTYIYFASFHEEANPQYYEMILVKKSDHTFSAETWNFKVAGSYVWSGSATSGKVLTADGSGGADWQTASGGTTLTQYTKGTSNISDFINIIKYAKGHVNGWVQLKPTSSGNWTIQMPITCFSYAYTGGTAIAYFSFTASYTSGSDDTKKGTYIADGYINTSNAIVLIRAIRIKTDFSIENVTEFRFGSFYASYWNDTEIT